MITVLLFLGTLILGAAFGFTVFAVLAIGRDDDDAN